MTIEKQFAESCSQVRAFAAQHRLRTKRENCGTKDVPLVDLFIPGKRGDSHIFYDGETMAVMFMPDGGNSVVSKKWGYHKTAMLEAGFTIAMDCDGEGIARFDSANDDQARLAMKIAGIFPRRQLSAEARLAGAARLAALRLPKKPAVEPQLES